MVVVPLPAGLPVDAAARRIAGLAREALRLSMTGVGLKDESSLDTLASGRTTSLPEP